MTALKTRAPGKAISMSERIHADSGSFDGFKLSGRDAPNDRARTKLDIQSIGFPGPGRDEPIAADDRAFDPGRNFPPLLRT